MDIQLFPDRLGRLLHEPLHKRIVAFAEQYTPEIPAEVVATQFLNRFYNGDNSVHILVALDDNFVITSHAIIEVQNVFGYVVVWCHQVQSDRKSTGSLDKGMEYIENLATTIHAHCILFTVTKNMKALEKKYGFTVSRSIMIKLCNADDDNKELSLNVAD